MKAYHIKRHESDMLEIEGVKRSGACEGHNPPRLTITTITYIWQASTSALLTYYKYDLSRWIVWTRPSFDQIRQISVWDTQFTIITRFIILTITLSQGFHTSRKYKSHNYEVIWGARNSDTGTDPDEEGEVHWFSHWSLPYAALGGAELCGYQLYYCRGL
jgi:hypothetical protein